MARKTELAKARKVIASALDEVDEDVLGVMLCAVLGHPPVVEVCWGYENCARCGRQVGDSLGGIGTAQEKMVVGHDCEKCDEIKKSLTPEQKLLTKLAAARA